MTVEIGRTGVIPDDPPIVLRAATPGGDQPVAFLWEVQDGIPSLAGGDTVAVTFEPVRPVEKLVRLTAFTEQGCVVTRARLINISKPEG